MSSDDKACPFCGNRDLRAISDDRVEADQCRTCKAVGPPKVIGHQGPSPSTYGEG